MHEERDLELVAQSKFTRHIAWSQDYFAIENLANTVLMEIERVSKQDAPE